MAEHMNQMPAKTGKIYGFIKMGANTTDKRAIAQLQKQGYNEHEIQDATGVHYSVVRSFMKANDPDFEPTEAPVTPDTKHLHDRIAELEAKLAEKGLDEETDGEY